MRTMKRTWIRKLIGGLSLTSALFVFQACYGTPQDFGLDLFIEGQVKSKTSGLPIEGIKVSVANNPQFTMTDGDGKFILITEMIKDLTLRFQDVDSLHNGYYTDKDTVMNLPKGMVFLDIKLEEK
jgi:hypothetical protein